MSNDIDAAIRYVKKHATRGACTCGRCIDAPESPEDKQPVGDTVDLTFFKVGHCGGDKDEFESLFRNAFPDWFDGKENSYLSCGADIGDQGICLMAFGLGHLLKVWDLLAPETLMPFLDKETKKMMAGRGMVSIQANRQTI